MYFPDQEINPPNSYFEIEAEYDKYQCAYCSEIYTDADSIHADPLSNVNICTLCLDNDDAPYMFGMTEYQFEAYKEKVLKLKPINNL